MVSETISLRERFARNADEHDELVTEIIDEIESLRQDNERLKGEIETFSNTHEANQSYIERLTQQLAEKDAEIEMLREIINGFLVAEEIMDEDCYYVEIHRDEFEKARQFIKGKGGSDD